MIVLVDGVALPDADGRAMWQRFSDWMEEHRGDLAGFAKQEGFASVHPGVANGKPVLIASKTAAQKPYGPVREDIGSERRQPTPSGSRGGSNASHRPGNDRNQRPQNTKKTKPSR